MTTRRPWFSRMSQGLWAVCLIATGLSSIACAQGPATVVPAPREGRWMDLHKSFLERAKKGNSRPAVPRRFDHPGMERQRGLEAVLRPPERGQFRHRRRPDPARPLADPERRARGDRAQGRRADDRHQQRQLGHRRRDRARGQGDRRRSCGIACPRPRSCCSASSPAARSPTPTREKLQAVNEKIARLDDGSHVKYLDIGKAFLNEDGTISREIMPDYLHLSQKGYRIWADAMEPTLWSMLDEPH